MRYLTLLLFPLLLQGTCKEYTVTEEEVNLSTEEKEIIVRKKPFCKIGEIRTTYHYRYETIRCEPE
jgi:hypothetical protein